jgi:hypothetical protein
MSTSCAVRRRLKSRMLCTSDYCFRARPSSVSVALTVTTIPGTGGSLWTTVRASGRPLDLLVYARRPVTPPRLIRRIRDLA